MKAKKILSLLLVFVLCLSMAACGDKDDKKSGSDKGKQEEGKLDSEQYINDYFSSDPTSLDVSLRSDSYSSSVLINVMEGLIRLEEKDGEYVTSPGDAQTWESNEEGTVWTFHLGDNKWSDGEPVTADQYVYSIQRSADPATGCPNGWFLEPILNYDDVSTGKMKPSDLGVKALDEKTLEITLSASKPSFLEMCNATVYYPQREDKMKEWGEKYGTEADKTIYNGPYVLDSWTHNSKLVMKKNPNYWNAANVKMETVNIAILKDVTSTTNAYQSGETDYVAVSTQEWLDEFKADEGSKYESVVGPSLVFNFYNTKDKLFKNENIRRAFTLAIDQKDLNEMCLGNLRIPTYGWVPTPISVGAANFREEAGDPILEQKKELEANGETPKDLLLKGMEELGLGDDPSKLDLTFSLAGTDDWFRTMGEYLQQVYNAELGVDLKIDFSEWGAFYENVQNGKYQMAYMSWGAYYNDPYDMLSIFYSKWDQVETGWVNKDFDALVDKGSVEMDEKARMQIYIEAEKLLMDDSVVCPVATAQTHAFYKSYVYGYSKLGFATNGYKDMYTSGRK